MDKVFITIGHPNSTARFLSKVETNVSGEQEARKLAKTLRKDVAENSGSYGFAIGVKFKPAEFYWAIFLSKNDEKPSMVSENYFWGVNGAEIRGEEYPRKNNSWYDTGYFDAKYDVYDSPKNLDSKILYEKGWDDFQESSEKVIEIFTLNGRI